jgi:hypothetical protein
MKCLLVINVSESRHKQVLLPFQSATRRNATQPMEGTWEREDEVGVRYQPGRAGATVGSKRPQSVVVFQERTRGVNVQGRSSFSDTDCTTV